MQSFAFVSALENLLLAGGAAVLASSATGYWRRIYANIAAAGAIYMFGVLVVRIVVDRNDYSRGNLYNLPLIISFLWLGATGLFAYRNRRDEAKFTSGPATEPSAEKHSTAGTLL